MQHVHVSALDAMTVFAIIILFGFLWRLAASKLRDTELGKAMAFIY